MTKKEIKEMFKITDNEFRRALNKGVITRTEIKGVYSDIFIGIFHDSEQIWWEGDYHRINYYWNLDIDNGYNLNIG